MVEQLRWDFKWLRKTDEHIVPSTSKSEEITKNGGLTTTGDVLFDNLHGQHATWAFLLPSYKKRNKKQNKKNPKELQEIRKFHWQRAVLSAESVAVDRQTAFFF